MQKPGLFGMNGFMGLLLTCFSFAVRAQQPGYLILMDAENRQSFAVRVGDQSYFSSGHGHLVLSQLKDSTYKLGFRFPKKNIAEQVFTVAIHKKDLGFQLKGSDTSLVLFNWQTKETIRPAYGKDSTRLLDQGVKRDDAFSRLMAAVVNDTAVMYNTYAGNGFGNDSNSVIVKNQKPTDAQNLKARAQGFKSDSLATVSAQRTPGNVQSPKTIIPNSDSLIKAKGQQAAITVQSPVANHPAQPLDKDSLLAVKRQEIRLQDSLNTVRKTGSRDSLILARKQEAYLKDSLNTARKTAIRDSISTAKKRQTFLKDSLVAVRKATKDSLAAARKNGGSAEDLMVAKRIQKTNDSLMAVNKEKLYQDSLVAVNRANFVKDSLDQSAGPVAGSHHSSLTQVKKLREVSLKISRKMVFLDIGRNGHTDTVTLFVYFESGKPETKKPGAEPLAIKKSIPPDSTEVKKLQSANPNMGLDTIGLNKTAKIKNPDSSALNRTTVKKSSAKATEASVCQAATDDDTDALRAAILKANSEQEKIAVAAGAFAMKCFSVSQVRFLASLLISDKAKYGLMDAAHWHLVDRDHFPELVDMLTDKNFQRKFLVMAEKRS
jgi:hypothetical protein